MELRGDVIRLNEHEQGATGFTTNEIPLNAARVVYERLMAEVDDETAELARQTYEIFHRQPADERAIFIRPATYTKGCVAFALRDIADLELGLED